MQQADAAQSGTDVAEKPPSHPFTQRLVRL